jgi:hypothetical protein
MDEGDRLERRVGWDEFTIQRHREGIEEAWWATLEGRLWALRLEWERSSPWLRDPVYTAALWLGEFLDRRPLAAAVLSWALVVAFGAALVLELR